MDQHEPFTGVYELLAVRLPDEDEKRFHERLVNRAAETSRSELLFRYTNARRLRPQARQKLAAEVPDESRHGEHEDAREELPANRGSERPELVKEDETHASEQAGERPSDTAIRVPDDDPNGESETTAARPRASADGGSG